MVAKRKLSSSRMPDGSDAEDTDDIFSDSEDDANSADYFAAEQEPEVAGVSPLHAIFMAMFYGGFGLLGVFQLTWIMCWFMNKLTDPLGLQRMETILERQHARDMMRLVGLPFVGLSVYYIRQRDDAAFLRSTVYGRLVAGGLGVSAAIVIFRTLPSACWFVWCADVFPALLLLRSLGEMGKEATTGAIHPIHGLWGAFFYFTFGILGATRQMWILADGAALFEVPGQDTTLGDLILPDGAQAVMRLSGLPLCALGFYYFRHRGDRDFMLSSVYTRLLIGGLGLLSEVVIFQTLAEACWIVFILEVGPALLCFRALRNAGQCGCFMEEPEESGSRLPLNEDLESEPSAEV